MKAADCPIAKLNHSCVELSSFYDMVPLGMWKTRIEDGQFVSANIYMARMLGFQDVEDLLKHKSTEFYSEEQRKKLIELLDEKQVICGYESCLKRLDGSYCWVSFIARYDHDGKHIVGSMTDITPEKELRMELEDLKNNQISDLKTVITRIKSRLEDEPSRTRRSG